MILDPIKAALFIFVAVLVQVSMLSAYSPLGGRADIVLVAVLSLALLRGSLFGAIGGFAAGLLLAWMADRRRDVGREPISNHPR